MPRVEEVMTRPAVTVEVSATVGEIATLLRRHRISGLPVVDGEGRILGVVSESDLLRPLVHAETLGMLADRATPLVPERPTRATARSAAGLMSQPAITVRPQSSTDEALRLMRRRAVRRLPVIDAEGRPLGMVSRTDLLQPFVQTDEELRAHLLDEVIPGLDVDPAALEVSARDGNVLVAGMVADRTRMRAVEEAIRDAGGVVSVESRLRCRSRAGTGPVAGAHAG